MERSRRGSDRDVAAQPGPITESIKNDPRIPCYSLFFPCSSKKFEAKDACSLRHRVSRRRIELSLLPKLRKRPRREGEGRSCPQHRAWVRKHHCSVPGCGKLPIECAHVRRGTDGAKGLKPSDKWSISLCCAHHAEQHRIGEAAFERRYHIDLLELAGEFARRSPHRHLWEAT